VFNRTAVVLSHISSHFLIPLSDSSLICALYSARAVTRHFVHYNRFYIFITLSANWWRLGSVRWIGWRTTVKRYY